MDLQKIPLTIPSPASENLVRLQALFPSIVKDGQVDIEALKAELGQFEEAGKERYELTWAGKQEAKRVAAEPLVGRTLKYVPTESKNLDSTENLYIEGDNLEVLKLLQNSYSNKIKMIYIDPPYNTGKNFVYKDAFSMTEIESAKSEGDMGEEGERYAVNPKSSGKYHANWLSMMYPRLRLAKNLLRDDGVIFISIDDNEIDNLKKIMDEVFGEGNFVFQITLLCNPKGRSQDKYIATCHEYLVGYSKEMLNKGDLNVLKNEEEIIQNYKLHDERGRYRELELRNTHREFGKHNRQNLYYPFYVSSSGRVSLEKKTGFDPIFPDWEDGYEGCWTWGLEKSQTQLDEIVARKVDNKWKIYRKNYALKDDGDSSKQVKSIWTEKEFHTEKGQIIFNDLFETKEKIFPSPKAVDTIKQLLLMGHTKNEFILDFFSGSSTTAHAVMQLNAEDGGSRKFIMVQLPEACDEKSEAYKAGYKTICDIGKERIRRAGEKIQKEHPEVSLDTGFKVFKTDTTTIKWIAKEAGIKIPSPQSTLITTKTSANDLRDFMPGVTDMDVVYEILLRQYDIPLSAKTESLANVGKRTYCFAEVVVVCLEEKVTDEIIDTIASIEPSPHKVIFRDSAFGRDISLKINAMERFDAMMKKHVSKTKQPYTVEFL
ncbi:hypothetical protein SDC9_23754 [bioreactor metagenome]|uniref:DNA methylase N-4/N-6 domain-containing protein n=1 Tax=bioreactor metagenome TaxID=1076179 RepID=A0A644UG22_9ZZZZ